MFRAIALPILLCGLQAGQKTDKAQNMTAAEVAEHVKRKDWDLPMHPAAIDRGAAPALIELLDDGDSQVRELSLACLNIVGGPSAVQGFFHSLHDRVDTVRAAAVHDLAAHAKPEDIPGVEEELKHSRDPYVREQLALLLGRTGSSPSASVLKSALAAERDEHAKRAISLALSRLGDDFQLRALVARLGQEDARERVSALRDLIYVNRRNLLKAVIPLLDDQRPGLNTGPSSRAFVIRVCDVAVNVSNELLGKPFPWVGIRKRYTPEQIAQVRTLLAAPGL